MFANEEQRSRAVQALLARWPGRFWTDDGPTAEAIEVRDGCSPASGGEQVMVSVAWALWNGEGDAKVADLLRLDPDALGAVAGLLNALNMGSAAIEAWCEAQSRTASGPHVAPIREA